MPTIHYHIGRTQYADLVVFRLYYRIAIAGSTGLTQPFCADDSVIVPRYSSSTTSP